MIYEILSYNTQEDYYTCEDREGKKVKIDMFRNSSYKGFGNLRKQKDLDKKYKSFIGKYVEIDSLLPYIPLYFARNAKLIK